MDWITFRYDGKLMDDLALLFTEVLDSGSYVAMFSLILAHWLLSFYDVTVCIKMQLVQVTDPRTDLNIASALSKT